VVLDISADEGHLHFFGIDLTHLGEGAGLVREHGLGARVEGWGCALAPLYWQDLISWAIRGAARANYQLRKVVPMGQVATIASESDTDSGIAEQFAEAVRIVTSLSSATDPYPATDTYPSGNPGTENEMEDAVKEPSDIVRLVKAALVEATGRAGASQVCAGLLSKRESSLLTTYWSESTLSS